MSGNTLSASKTNPESTDKDEDLLTTLEACYEFYLRGLDFAPIDIYKSHATKFNLEDGKLLPPFVAVSGLGESAAWDIMEGREGQALYLRRGVQRGLPQGV